jgi:hypothetical protein
VRPNIGFAAIRIDDHPARHAARDHVHAEIAARQVVLECDRRSGFDEEIAVADAGRDLASR